MKHRLYLMSLDVKAFCEDVGTNDMGILWPLVVIPYLLTLLVIRYFA